MIRALSTTLADFSAELKNPRSLTLGALLAAIYAVSYSPVAGNFVIVPGVIEIRFGFIAIAVVAALSGPVMAALVAFIGDIIGTLLFYGGSFFWGYTLSWVLLGIVFGVFFYKEKISVPRVIFSMLFNTCIINLLLTTKWEQMMGFGTFEALFVKRLMLNIIMLPVNTILLFLVLRAVCAAYGRLRLRNTGRQTR